MHLAITVVKSVERVEGGVRLRSLDLHRFSRLFTAYTELRAQENRTVTIVSVRGNISTNSRTGIGGISARVNQNGSWGFASSPTCQESHHISNKAASENAAFLDQKREEGQGSLAGDNRYL